MTDANVIVGGIETAEAVAAGTEVASEWRGGVQALVRMCVGLRKGMLAFQRHKALLDAFLSPLVACGFLTASDALLGRSCAKISMLMQIAEHENVVTRPEIARRLSDGFTIVYQATVIFRRLPGDEAEKVERLAGILAKCPQDGAREYLLGVTRQLRQAVKAKITPASAQPAPHGVAPHTTLRDVINADRRFDLLLVTPDEALRLIDADYPEDGQHEEMTLERCLPVHRVISQDSGAVVVTTINNMSVVEERLLPLCGFDRPARFILSDHPVARDLTGANIILVAKRGMMQLALNEEKISNPGPLEPISFAGELFPSAENRLHLFAPGETPGWTSLAGDNSWLERPSLR